MRSTYFILGNTFVPRSARGGGRWGWRLLVDLVQMLEQKTMRNGTFFKLGSAQRCHRLGSEKQHFSRKRVGFLKSDRKNAVIMGKIQTENLVKRVPVFYILSTLFRICFAILCSSNGTKLTWKRTPPSPPPPDLFTYSRLLTSPQCSWAGLAFLSG